MPKRQSPFERIVYILQGGGALGAYQAGVFDAFSQQNYLPDWIIGNSIGSINASIIVGNKPENRMNKLREFWQTISKPVMAGFVPQSDIASRWFHYLSGQLSVLFGLPGFFLPRLNRPLLAFHSSADKISFYVTDPLVETLHKVIDFDVLNNSHIRLTLGAVEIESGRAVYFDNTKMELNDQHILASCALPPGFPAIEIDKKFYWDEGVLTNSPVEYLMAENKEVNTLCFMMHLFDSTGLNPTCLDDVLRRHKDISYSSHYLSLLHKYKETHQLKHIIRDLLGKLPQELSNSSEIKALKKEMGGDSIMHFVHLLYQTHHEELSSLDYDFSTQSIMERLNRGYQDGKKILDRKPWLDSVPVGESIILHEIHARHPSTDFPL